MAKVGSTSGNSVADAVTAKGLGFLRLRPAPSVARLRGQEHASKASTAPASALLCSMAASCCACRCLRSSRIKRRVTAERTARREELMRPKTATSNKWQWRDNITVHYAKAASKIPGSDTAVVLLHGFGVASFHYEAQFGPLSEAGYTVYAADNAAG